jgi:hypothetical protein
MSQKRVEYNTLLTNHTEWKKWHLSLNELAEVGWRVVGVVGPLKSGIPFTDAVIILLEREISEVPKGSEGD